jgi:NAD(P)H-flavin reductase
MVLFITNRSISVISFVASTTQITSFSINIKAYGKVSKQISRTELQEKWKDWQGTEEEGYQK